MQTGEGTYKQRKIAFELGVRNEEYVTQTITYLVSDNQDILLSLKLHDDRFESDDDISIRLPTWETIILIADSNIKEVRSYHGNDS